MSRNWGLPSKETRRALRDAKVAKPLLTLLVSAVFGIFGAAIAVMSFVEARDALSGLFHGPSLVAAIVSAGFGCWIYIWLARPRFAAQFTGRGDVFSSLLRFYAVAAVVLILIFLAGQAAIFLAPKIAVVLLLCMSGGAGAAAAFQTVLAFVPYYDDPQTNNTSDA
jgi:hypothetical protein